MSFSEQWHEQLLRGVSYTKHDQQKHEEVGNTIVDQI